MKLLKKNNSVLLKYDLFLARNIKIDPRSDMKKLGIIYEESHGWSMAEAIIFTGCYNLPKKLPKYIEIFEDESKLFKKEDK